MSSRLCNPRDPGALLSPDPAEPGGFWAPVDVPQTLPGWPHNLPPLRDRPTFNPFTGMDPASVPSGGALPGGLPFTLYDPHHYANLIQGVLAVGVASIQVITQPATRRNFLSFRNSSPGTEVLYISFGSLATVNAWLALEAGQIALFDTVVPQNDVYCIASAATGQLSYAYSTIA